MARQCQQPSINSCCATKNGLHLLTVKVSTSRCQMKWESLGFKDNPFNTDPIMQSTIALYTGQEKLIKVCQNVLLERNVVIVIEGARGVGTTSFANFLRFSAQTKKDYFTPSNEIRVGAGWSAETLLSVIIANIVREIELLQNKKIIKDKRFQDAKALSMRIAETYRSFGLDALGFGVSYGKAAGIISQPVIVPAAVLGHHLEDLAVLIQSSRYKYGILLQLNNLDVGEIHDEKHLKYLFNELRDYVQTNNVSWLFVGDIGLRKFIAQQVDRLDDIISYETEIQPLNKPVYVDLIEKRIQFYKNNPKAQLPIEKEVFLYLFDLTKGRLRYVFGLIKRLLNELDVGDIVDKLTLNLVKPMVMRFAKERLEKNGLTTGEEDILKKLVELGPVSGTELSQKLSTTRQYVSKALVKLSNAGLLNISRAGSKKIYSPVLDVMIAYNSL